MPADEERTGVQLTNLDQPLSGDDDVTKRDLVDYLEAVADRFVPVLAGPRSQRRRVRPGQAAVHAEEPARLRPRDDPDPGRPTQDGKRVVHYPVCDDRETLLWFANQRAVEYHPTLFRELASDAPTHLVVDLDPPAGSDAFAHAVQAPSWYGRCSADAGLAAMVKTSGAKGVHVVVPLAPGQSAMDAAAATRAVAVRRNGSTRC
jgi:DNA primase